MSRKFTHTLAALLTVPGLVLGITAATAAPVAAATPQTVCCAGG